MHGITSLQLIMQTLIQACKLKSATLKLEWSLPGFTFSKVDQRLILTAGDHADLLFVRPYTKELDTPMALDFSDIVDAIEKSENHTVIFATPLDEANSPETAHKSARFFTEKK